MTFPFNQNTRKEKPMSKHTVGVQILTPEEAKFILDNENFPGQRHVKKDNVIYLKSEYNAGHFDTGESIRFATYAGRRYLINGQHRLEMLSKLDEPLELVVVTTKCASLEEVAHLYARIDRGRGRTVVDALRGLGLYVDSALSQTQMNALGACAPLFQNKLHGFADNHTSRSAEAREPFITEYLTAATKYFSAVKGSLNEKFFQRREIAVVGISTFNDNPANEKAYEFWAKCAADDGLSAADPRKAALEFMRRTKPTNYGVGALAHGVTACWNAYYRDDPLRLVKVLDPTAPLRIMGTRWWKRKSDGSPA
jgi:hypothetical protein